MVMVSLYFHNVFNEVIKQSLWQRKKCGLEVEGTEYIELNVLLCLL